MRTTLISVAMLATVEISPEKVTDTVDTLLGDRDLFQECKWGDPCNGDAWLTENKVWPTYPFPHISHSRGVDAVAQEGGWVCLASLHH